MRYRPFGKDGFKVSALGFGAMRLPLKEGKIDREHSRKMLYHAIDRGVNYVDTAYPYHGGESETFLGEALVDGYREKVRLATKMPSWLVEKTSDFDKFLNEQLTRLKTDTIDYYLLHTLNKDNWPKLRELGVLEWAEKARAEGRFRMFGFSFHDDTATFKSILDAYPWDFCQIQYNYMDVENQAGTEGLKYAASRDIPVIIMEPLLGGKLVAPPLAVQRVWDGADRPWSATEWALQWLWNQKEVGTVLSGMSTLDQVVENITAAERSGPEILTTDELTLFDEARESYKKLNVIPCTACGYCMPCPEHVDIPGNLGVYNAGVAFDKPESSRGQYDWWKYAFTVQKIFDHDIRAACCIACGICEAKCPQHIPISRWMPVIHEVLGEGKPYKMKLD